LLAYVKAGGVVVAQYNTTADLKTKEIGPFPFEISRDASRRNARFEFSHRSSVADTPNKISSDDFKGWVQERGLISRTNGIRTGRPCFPATIRRETA